MELIVSKTTAKDLEPVKFYRQKWKFLQCVSIDKSWQSFVAQPIKENVVLSEKRISQETNYDECILERNICGSFEHDMLLGKCCPIMK